MSASSSTLSPVTVPSFFADEGQLLPLVAAVVAGQQRLGPGLGVLDRLAELPGHAKVTYSSGVVWSLPPKPPPTSGAMTPDLRLGDARRGGEQEPEDVRDLGRPTRP